MARYGVDTGKRIDFAAGETVTGEIQRKNLLHALNVRIRGNVVVTGGTGAGAPRSRHAALARLVRQVSLLADNNTLQSWYGHALATAMWLLDEEEYAQTLPTDDAAGTYPIDVTYRIPFHELRSLSPDFSAFPSFAVANPQLSISYGNASDLFDADVDATGIAFSDMQVDVIEETLLGTDRNAGRYARPVVVSVNQDVTVDTDELPITLENIKPGMEVSRILIQAFSGGSASDIGDPDDSLIETVKLEIGNKQEIRAPWAVLQNIDKRAYALEAKEAGVVMLDSAKDRRTEPGVGQLWEVRGLDKPVVTVKAAKQTGNCRIRITAIARIAPNGAQAGGSRR